MQKKIERLMFLVQELCKLLEENRGHNHLYGVRGLLGILTDESYPLDERLKQAKNSYKHMMGGAGTLGDFAIWHEDNHKMTDLNKYLVKVEDELWDLLECGLSHLPSVEEGYPPGHIYWTLVDKEEGKKNIFKSLREFIIRIFRRS